MPGPLDVGAASRQLPLSVRQMRSADSRPQAMSAKLRLTFAPEFSISYSVFDSQYLYLSVSKSDTLATALHQSISSTKHRLRTFSCILGFGRRASAGLQLGDECHWRICASADKQLYMIERGNWKFPQPDSQRRLQTLQPARSFIL